MKINTALILCAGFGKRLNPLTLQDPKPLLKINNSTLLEECIKLVKALGIQKIIINTFHLKEKITKFLKEKNFDLDIKIIDDGDVILNTGGGIQNMINSSNDNNFLTFNPDTFWDLKYLNHIKEMEKFYFSKKIQNILMVVNKDLSFDKDLKGDFSLADHHLKKNDVNSFIYIGCQIINKSLFENYQVRNFSISEIWNKLLKENELYGYESKKNFYHLTNLEIYKKLLKNK
jgi:MurNAc alpha-1-phosphate uridylyltransferase